MKKLTGAIFVSTILFATLVSMRWQEASDDFEVRGEAVKIDVATTPFKIKADNVTIEKLGKNGVRVTSDSGRLRIPLAGGEAIYGLTERIVPDKEDSESMPAAVGGLDRRGEIVPMWIEPTIAGYTPFYISSRGYGMLIEGYRPGVYDIGKTDPDTLDIQWDIGDKPLSCVFFYGPSYIDILDQYTELTGRPVLPPRWAFLPWKWRGEIDRFKFDKIDGVLTNAEIVDDIKNYEKHDFPAGVYMIDRPWGEGQMGAGNFQWDPTRIPNGDRMVKALHDRGWRVTVWGAPWAIGRRPGTLGWEARKKGYVIGTSCIDYTNPAAMDWHAKKIEEFIRRSDVDGWKLDRSEERNPSTKSDIYHDGRTGFAVHNQYPVLYAETYYKGTKAARGDDFILLPRAAYTGSQKYAAIWAGDTRARYFPDGNRINPQPTDLGLRSVIISQLRMSFMGFPLWGSDTGGYLAFTKREQFARWIQFSAFCPIMEIGGKNNRNEPWDMRTKPHYDEEMIKIFRRYTWIHARLADYTHSLAQRAHQTGNPIVHPLVFDWPDDDKVVDMWDEYMYGPSLLVAPIWDTKKFSREVYLPEGKWTYLWDKNKVHEGPATITVDAPLDIIPVFIRSGEEDRLPDDLIDGL